MRVRWLVAALVVVGALLLAPVTAYADPPGNNGTIKIHDSSEKEPIEMDNEPHPGCVFHIHGFNFDASSHGTWWIKSWPPTGNGSTVMGPASWSANASGEWRSTDISSLPSGHYKAFAKQDNSPGGDKQKVFWVQCGGSSPTTTAPGSNAPSGNAPSGNAPSGTTPGTSPNQGQVTLPQQTTPRATLPQQSAPNVTQLPNTSTR